MTAWIAGEIKDGLATDVAREDQHRVGEVHCAALSIGDAPVIEDLQHHVEDIGVRLLHLVEEDHGIGPAPDGFGELSAFLVADIARRRTDQAADGVLLHVLGHVDAHHGVLAVKELGGQCLGELGFADSGGAEEEEAGNRPVGIAQAGAGALDGIGNRGHGLLLANHPGVELLLKLQQFLHLALHQLGDRNPRPLGDHLGDVVFGDLLAQQ